jgi:hypothetical protein
VLLVPTDQEEDQLQTVLVHQVPILMNKEDVKDVLLNVLLVQEVLITVLNVIPNL